MRIQYIKEVKNDLFEKCFEKSSFTGIVYALSLSPVELFQPLGIYRSFPPFLGKIVTQDNKARVKYEAVLRLIYHIPRVDANRAVGILKETVLLRIKRLIESRLVIIFWL
jgi:hypothetical protein